MNRSLYENLKKLQLTQVNIEKSIEAAIDIFVDRIISLSDKRR